jgi:chromosome segregation and condensation protein ScpB
MAELKLVERAVLLALMAAGEPLRESADLTTRLGINVKKVHRDQLLELALITTTPRPLTYALTEKGWAWTREELRAPRPKGIMGQGALYAVLHGLGRYSDRSGLSLPEIFCDAAPSTPKPAPGPELLYRDAAIVEVDKSLALALQDEPVLLRAIARVAASKEGDLPTEAASKLVMQWVKRAAELRRIAPVQEQGDTVTFDPLLHDSDDAIDEGESVIVRKAPITRGRGSDCLVLARGKVIAA